MSVSFRNRQCERFASGHHLRTPCDPNYLFSTGSHGASFDRKPMPKTWYKSAFCRLSAAGSGSMEAISDHGLSRSCATKPSHNTGDLKPTLKPSLSTRANTRRRTPGTGSNGPIDVKESRRSSKSCRLNTVWQSNFATLKNSPTMKRPMCSTSRLARLNRDCTEPERCSETV